MIALSNTDCILYLTICPCIFILQVLMMFLFYQYPSLMIKPGNIFLALIIIECILNLHLFSSARNTCPY